MQTLPSPSNQPAVSIGKLQHMLLKPTVATAATDGIGYSAGVEPNNLACILPLISSISSV
jgi:hypothetical protein